MKVLVSPATFVIGIVWLATAVSAQQDEPTNPQDMMARMKQHATPGEHHQFLGQMVGKWKTKMTVMGMPPTEGEADFKWILGKRFVQQSYKGSLMGMDYEGVGLFGYDNYKKKFTSTWLDSISTTKNDGEGLLDRSGKVINYYGTLDEYLTGEHDKPVKYVLDFSKENEINFEIHDLAIGENSKVIGIKYTRIK